MTTDNKKFIVEGKLADNERLKEQSNFLRGTVQKTREKPTYTFLSYTLYLTQPNETVLAVAVTSYPKTVTFYIRTQPTESHHGVIP